MSSYITSADQGLKADGVLWSPEAALILAAEPVIAPAQSSRAAAAMVLGRRLARGLISVLVFSWRLSMSLVRGVFRAASAYLAVGLSIAAVFAMFGGIVTFASSGGRGGAGASFASSSFLLAWVGAPVYLVKELGRQAYADERVAVLVDGALEAGVAIADVVTSVASGLL